MTSEEISSAEPPSVLLVGELAAAGLAQLRDLLPASVRWNIVADFDDPELARRLRTADVLVTNRFLAEWGPWSKRLRLLQLHSAGFDNVAFEMLPPGCLVANVYGHDRAIAEFVMLQVLALTRRLVPRDRRLRRGEWDTAGLDEELEGKTLGILGFGSVGRAIAPLAQAFGMRVVAIKRTADPGVAREQGLGFLGGRDDLPQLLAEADVLVVATPLDATSRGLVGAAELARMKSGASVVNIARGPVIEEDALYEALKERRIASAALDVWYAYPQGRSRTHPSRHPFHELENVVMTPHVAALTTGTFRRRWRTVASNIERLMLGDRPDYLVPSVD